MNRPDPLKFHLGALATAPTQCACGRRHEVPFDAVIVRLDALAEAPGIFGDLGIGRNCCLVADANTQAAAGIRLESLMRAAGWRVTSALFDARYSVKPTAASIGEVLLTMASDTDLLVAVGSGCLTDVTRLVGARTRIPFVSVPTAPSVDAYTSDTSPITHRGFKQSFAAAPPRAVIADIGVLAEAPVAMIASGFGDTLAKLISRCDWQLSALITGEYYCPEIDSNVTSGVRRCRNLEEEIRRGEPVAVGTLAESLMVSGAAMTLVGTSRPASGAEHAMSHYWEMKMAHGGIPARLHGTMVGVATVVMALFWERFGQSLASIDPDSLDSAHIFSERRSVTEIRSLLVPPLGPVAEILISQVTGIRLLPEAKATERLHRLQSEWPRMAVIASEVPASQELADSLRTAGAPAHPADLDVGSDELRETLFGALEVRSRFSVLSAAEALGWLERIINEVVESVSG